MKKFLKIVITIIGIFLALQMALIITAIFIPVLTGGTIDPICEILVSKNLAYNCYKP